MQSDLGNVALDARMASFQQRLRLSQSQPGLHERRLHVAECFFRRVRALVGGGEFSKMAAQLVAGQVSEMPGHALGELVVCLLLSLAFWSRNRFRYQNFCRLACNVDVADFAERAVRNVVGLFGLEAVVLSQGFVSLFAEPPCNLADIEPGLLVAEQSPLKAFDLGT